MTESNFVAACLEIEPSMPAALAGEAFRNGYHDAAEAVAIFEGWHGKVPCLYPARYVPPVVLDDGRWRIYAGGTGPATASRVF